MLEGHRFRKNAWYLLGATRGGGMRARLMLLLLERPLNANQLAEQLQVDYKTVRHHLEVLRKNNWVTGSAEKYGEPFFPAFSPEQKQVFLEIWGRIGKSI